MSSLSSRGRALLVRGLKQANGVTVTYARVSGAPPLTLTNWSGLTTATSDGVPGRVELANRDYLIAVADLMVNGVEQPPAVGDRITETLNGAATVFEVMNPKPPEKAWRYSSQANDLYRVHCKRVI